MLEKRINLIINKMEKEANLIFTDQDTRAMADVLRDELVTVVAEKSVTKRELMTAEEIESARKNSSDFCFNMAAEAIINNPELYKLSSHRETKLKDEAVRLNLVVLKA